MFDPIACNVKARSISNIFAAKYPRWCRPDSDLYAALDELGSPGWIGLIDRLLYNLSSIDTGLDNIEIVDINATALGLSVVGRGFSSAQQEVIRFAQAESRTICEICGTRSHNRSDAVRRGTACRGCVLNESQKNSMALGWHRFGPKIVYELDGLSRRPIVAISSRAAALYINIQGTVMSERQERCFRLWNNELRRYCEVCGRDGDNARCTAHRFADTIQ